MKVKVERKRTILGRERERKRERERERELQTEEGGGIEIILAHTDANRGH